MNGLEWQGFSCKKIEYSQNLFFFLLLLLLHNPKISFSLEKRKKKFKILPLDFPFHFQLSAPNIDFKELKKRRLSLHIFSHSFLWGFEPGFFRVEGWRMEKERTEKERKWKRTVETKLPHSFTSFVLLSFSTWDLSLESWDSRHMKELKVGFYFTPFSSTFF